jgi:hypothetical protein
MRQFVDDDRTKEQKRRHCGKPNHGIAPLWVREMEMPGKRKRDQERNDELAIVKPYFDAENTAQLDLCLHGLVPMVTPL